MKQAELQKSFKKLEEIAEKASVVDELSALLKQRNAAMQKVQTLDEKINSLLSGKTSRRGRRKKKIKKGKAVVAGTMGPKKKKKSKKKKTARYMPAEGTAPYKLVEVMDPNKPMSKEDIANAVGVSPSTVSQYIQKFGCFKSRGRGKGYVCKRRGK